MGKYKWKKLNAIDRYPFDEYNIYSTCAMSSRDTYLTLLCALMARPNKSNQYIRSDILTTRELFNQFPPKDKSCLRNLLQ